MLNLILGFGALGMPEWLMILAAVLLLFGGKKIPELMKGIGKGIREFNSAKNNVRKEVEEGMKDDSEKE
jgi:sec-independent protein translocase protein TatA